MSPKQLRVGTFLNISTMQQDS